MGAQPRGDSGSESGDTHLHGAMTNVTNATDVEKNPEKIDYSGATNKTDAVEIALVKKLDSRIMPTMWAMYFMNYLDRNAIVQARLNNMEEDLGLVGSQWNTAISIMFVGYLFLQIPSNLLMSSGKIRPSLYMCGAMAAWGICTALTAICKDYSGLLVVRFFIGITQAPYYPGALYLLSIFYTRKEIATRISILYSGNIFATAFAGLIAAATFSSIDGAHGLPGWKWLFIIEGVVTVGVAAFATMLLPDSPLTTRWLTPEERQMAHDRIQRDTVGSEKSAGVLQGFVQAVKDPKLYLLVVMQNMHLSACGFNNFFPTVVGSLGFSTTMTLVLTCPPYLVSGFVGFYFGWSSGRFNERTWHITAGMGAAMVGYIISCITLNVGARYLSCFLFAGGAYAVNSVILGWVPATLGQTQEKKAASLSIVNTVANASYIYTAFLYPSSDAPYYRIAMSSNTAFAVVTIACAWALRFWLMSINKKAAGTGGPRFAY